MSMRAADFGLILDNTAGFSGNGDESVFDYTGLLIPRFSALLGNNGEFYMSAAARADYYKEWTFVPELLRTDVFFRFGSAAIRAGRMPYSDPLAYIANGLFDGARFTYDSAVGTFGAGAWYTGFLYKKRAVITMTAEEYASYSEKVDYSDFVNTYFAPKRLVYALDWEHPSLANLFMLNLAILGQYDLSDEDLNTEYAALSIAFPFKSFVVDLGGAFELIQNAGNSGTAFAADLGFTWALPTSFASQIGLLGRYASGSDGGMDAFLPINTVTQSNVLKPKLSGLSLISLTYLARLHQTVSLSLSDFYFIRNDLKTYSDFGDEGKLLGNEFYGKLSWSPLSDLQVNLGAGIFLPSLGNVARKAKGL
jgi:hypothetical protein